MSATRAACALLYLDCNLAAFAGECPEGYHDQKRERVTEFVRRHVMNTWTLSLAAQCAGVTEEQVVSALFYLEPFRFGSSCVCRGVARDLFANGGAA